MAKRRTVAAALQRGSILWVFLDDPSGNPILDDNGNPKSRPAMVITPTDEILQGKPISLVAISSKFKRSRIPSHWFPIQSHPLGDPITGLDQPSVVKANWLKLLDPAKIDHSHPIKRAPARVVRQVLNWLYQQP